MSKTAEEEEANFFSDTESESEYSEYESDHEEYDASEGYTDWKGKPIVFGFRDSFYPISAYHFSKSILKQYRYNREQAFKKTGYRLPITKNNVKGQIGRIHRGSSTIMDQKGKLVFP